MNARPELNLSPSTLSRGVWLSVVVAALGLTWAARATLIPYDIVAYQSGSGNISNPALLSGTLNMTVSGTTLTVLVQNTSAAGAAPAGSGAILSGFGFDLPTGVAVTGGSVEIANGSTGVNFAGGAGTDLSKQWGFSEPAKDLGSFSGTVGIGTVQGMVSPSGQDFTGTKSVQGPNYGAISKLGDAGGVQAVQDTVQFHLTLSTAASDSTLLNYIAAHDVVLAFSSPNTSERVPNSGQPVPDASTTAGLLAASLLALLPLSRAATDKRKF